MPALNELFQSITTIRYSTYALDALHKDLIEDFELLGKTRTATQRKEIVPAFAEALELRDVTFSHPEEEGRPSGWTWTAISGVFYCVALLVKSRRCGLIRCSTRPRPRIAHRDS